MSYVFNMHEAKTKLSKLVELVEAGEKVQIARAGVPVVDLSLSKQSGRPKFGEFEPLSGWISDDFDEPMAEWIEAMNKDLFEGDRKSV